MKRLKGLSLLVALSLAFTQGLLAQLADVTQPGDTITATSSNSPGSEGVTNAIDNAPTKYLNFDISDTGFTVTPSVGLTVVRGLSLQSANDAPDRDPVTYLLEGSYDGENFSEISSGDVAAFPERFQTNYIFFDNDVPFGTYRLTFPTVGGSTCCMQIAEVELLGAQAPADVTQPGDDIVATSANSPGSEGVTNAIDNAPTKYLNFDISNTGFTVTPSVGMTIVNGLSLQSANDGPDRDPVNYTLEGSYNGVDFEEISAGDVADFPDRFFTNYIFFDNTTPYVSYRLLFPMVDGSTCCMQIAEVELLGTQAPGDVTQPGDDIVATSANSPGSEGVTNAIDGQPTKYLNFDISDTGFTVTPSVGLTIVSGLSLQSANDAPDRDPVTYLLEGSYDGETFVEVSSGDVAAFPERFQTNYIFFDNSTAYLTYRLVFPTVGGSTCCMQIAEVEFLGVQLPGDVTQPGDDIVATSANSPGSEGVTNAIDNAPTKYLNFDISDTGFTVTPAVGLTEIIGLSLQSANDGPDRDPVTYLLEGSYDGVAFEEISSGSVADFPDRFFTNYIFFDNSTPYLTYRLLFPTVDGSTCCMQIAEVELFPRPGGTCSDLTFVDSGLIRLQPSDTPVLEGATATIAVVPTGPWNVQWESQAPGSEDWTAVAGATSTEISIADASADVDGTLYRAIVSTPGCEGQVSNAVALNLFTPSDTVSVGYSWIGGGANGAPTHMETTDIAGFHPQAYWNNLTGGTGDDFATVDVNDEETAVVNSNNEEVSGIGFEFTSDGTWGVGTGDGNPTQRMFNGMVRTDTKDPEIDILPEIAFFGVPQGSHTLILYSVQVPLEFFDMNIEVEGGNGTQQRFIRPQNSDEFNPSPGFILVPGETEATRSVGNMMIFSGIEPTSGGEIFVRFWAPNGDIQGPGLNGMQLVLDPPPAPPVPVITQNPESTNGVLGAGLSLSASVQGDDISIQWFKDGQPIGGATSDTYSVAELSESDAGVYSVAVTNPAGRILSRAAVVNVLEGNDILSGLVAHYPFDGNGDNAAGGPAAEPMNGASFGDGQVGQGLELSGNNQYALASDYEKPSEAATVSAWVRPESPDWGPVVRNWAGNAGEGRFGQIQLGTDFPFDALNPRAVGIIGVGPNEPQAIGAIDDGDRGSWHHLAMSANGATVTVYWDGEAIAIGDYLGNLNDPEVPWLAFGAALNLPLDDDGAVDFGGDPEVDESVFPWAGGIDDVAIWNRSLSGPEIASVFAAGEAGNPVTDAESVLNTEPGVDSVAPSLELTDGLVALWNFEDESFADSIGEFDGTAQGTAPIGFVPGRPAFGHAISLDGVDQFVEITGGASPDDLSFEGGSMSLSAWFKVGAFDKNWQAVIAKGEGTSWRVHRRSGEGGLGHAGGIGEGPAGADISIGEWHHLVAVTDATGANFGTALYIDGELYTSNAGAAVLAANGMPVMIGENPDARGRNFTGEIDEVALWNRVLSEEEVGTLFTGAPLGGPVVLPPPLPPVPGGDAGISGFSVDGSTLSIEFSGSLKSADTVSGPFSDVDGASSPFAVDLSAGGNKFYIAE